MPSGVVLPLGAGRLARFTGIREADRSQGGLYYQLGSGCVDRTCTACHRPLLWLLAPDYSLLAPGSWLVTANVQRPPVNLRSDMRATLVYDGPARETPRGRGWTH